MKKLFIPLIAFFLLLGAIAYGSLSQEGFGIPKKIGETPSSSEDIVQTNTQETQEEREGVVRDKIENIKKRLALKGLIIEGDTYYRNQKHTLALRKYLEFYKEHPSDPLIIEKIADTYHQTHKYKIALKYYAQIQAPNESIKIRMATLALYTNDLTTQTGRAKARADIDSVKLPDDVYFYYQNSITCLEDFGNCKFAFREYITSFNSLQEGEETLELHPKIALINQAFENFKNFKLEEEYLENAYIIGALYTDKLYPIAIKLGQKLLEEKQNYKPILKIIAQSQYELGEYQKAKDILTGYYEADSDDPSVAYLLGIINEKLGEYILANIYLKKALKIGYEPSIDVRRQLIHNYYLLKSDENMLRAFRELVEEEENLEKEDLGLAIYHHIIQEDLKTAQEWSQKGQEFFPESSNFYAYESWVLREKGEYDAALSILQNGLQIESKNPFIVLNIGYTLLEKGSTTRAKRYFSQAIDIAPESQFAIQARTELKKIEAEEKRQEGQKQEI